MPADKSPELVAVEKIFSTLVKLDGEAQDRVLTSVLALLGKKKLVPALQPDETGQQADDGKSRQSPLRRKGLTELVTEKNPGTNAQRIALFAYFRDKFETDSRFGRADLRDYFARAKLPPPQNYDRDFNAAVAKGWIHEDESDSYITSRGIEMVESGFEGERSYVPRAGSAAGRKK